MKNDTKITCPSCSEGQLRVSVQNYEASLPEGVKVTVPDVAVEICDNCGKVFIPEESAQKIDDFTRQADELLADHELESIRDEFGVDQTTMSEILGLGSKTYHRWENGAQIPSRSMCRYLRILSEFPQAFQWLRKAPWRQNNRIFDDDTVIDFKKAFPDLREIQGFSYSMKPDDFYPPSVLLRKVKT